MRNVKFDEVLKNGYENSKKFRKLSDYVVEVDVRPLAGELLDEAAKERISDFMSIDMAAGAELVKNKYIITGVIIGVTLTVGTVFIIKKVKERA